MVINIKQRQIDERNNMTRNKAFLSFIKLYYLPMVKYSIKHSSFELI